MKTEIVEFRVRVRLTREFDCAARRLQIIEAKELLLDSSITGEIEPISAVEIRRKRKKSL